MYSNKNDDRANEKVKNTKYIYSPAVVNRNERRADGLMCENERVNVCK